MTTERPLRAEREDISRIGREMREKGLTKGSGGNVSARSGDRVAVSPSGIPYEDITPETVPITDLNGTLRDGERDPSSETPMHVLIYAGRPDVGGIVHTHSPYASTFASLGEPIRASHYLIAFAGKEVPVAGYEPPGTEALGELAVNALGHDHDACLLQNHGVIAVGEDADAALETAEMVEFVAQIHYQASAIGDPVIMADDDLEYLVDMFGSYRQQSE
ncbi:class II aldolase/adducin family protein [Halomarina halobia]|uniref:Class II aldolase/adducin family protein n=1 Tax=Halomarina halobia TaxID=3033386 RepID=A0ABD6AEH8_9EURY|nr:class II aldolase/adducin family protein [Halomarina sp. PSR21]